MEIESKKKTYNKRRKSNKRNRKVACHRNGNHGVMNKRQLREFFGHKFGATEVRGQNLCLVAELGRIVR